MLCGTRTLGGLIHGSRPLLGSAVEVAPLLQKKCVLTGVDSPSSQRPWQLSWLSGLVWDTGHSVHLCHLVGGPRLSRDRYKVVSLVALTVSLGGVGCPSGFPHEQLQ